MDEPVWSVSAVNRAVRETLEGAFMPFWMGGEVGSITLHSSGHAYFQLKDDKSQMRGCFFNGASECRKLNITNGSLVEVWGNLSVYEIRGEYQFNIKKLRPAGIGELQRRFEEVKRKLEKEGLFDPARKKAIPVLPRIIGVVSSPTGAAIRDFLQVLTRRFPEVNVKLFPALVQGGHAAASVAKGVEFFNRTGGADVIVITRGGGSMEDLWPFNDEMLARTIAASKIPVISAVGHEIDFTICDFAADLRVPTPSAAAELVIGRRDEFVSRLDRAQRALGTMVELQLNRCRTRLELVANSRVFHEPQRLLELKQQYIDELELRRNAAAERVVAANIRRLDCISAALETLNPRRQLERGYAMVLEGNRVVTSSQQPPGKSLQIQFADGTLEVESR